VLTKHTPKRNSLTDPDLRVYRGAIVTRDLPFLTNSRWLAEPSLAKPSSIPQMMVAVLRLSKEELTPNKSLRIIKKDRWRPCLNKKSCTMAKLPASRTTPTTGPHPCLTTPAKGLSTSNRIRNLELKAHLWCQGSLLWSDSRTNNRNSTLLVKVLALQSTE
jgi:hypothetical protein